MQIGNGEHLEVNDPIVKKNKKNILMHLRRNGSMKESTLFESGEFTKRARKTILRMRQDATKKNLDRDRMKSKEKIDRKTKEAQILAKAKIDDFKSKKKDI